MSCHSIGYAMNHIANTVIDLYDQGEIAWATAVKLIHEARMSIGFCDGNDYEAIEDIERRRCGYCLRKMETGEPLYPLVNYGVCGSYPEEDDFEETLATYYLCTDCYDTLVEKNTGDPTAGPKARQGIAEELNEDFRLWHAE